MYLHSNFDLNGVYYDHLNNYISFVNIWMMMNIFIN